MNYKIFDRIFQNIRFLVAIPAYPTYKGRNFRILISQHGTRQVDGDRGADEYVQYPLDHNDPYWYDLVVVSPHFPASNIATGSPHGEDFYLFNGPGLQWIHDLVHQELQNVFSDSNVLQELGVNQLNVETNRFYFFGQSLGGMTVHTYIMQFRGVDIFRATSCGGKLRQRDQSNFNNLSDADYLQRLDSFISTSVASVLGTDESAVRIESVRSFICREIAQRVSADNVNLVSPLPPVSLGATDAALTCDLFPQPTIAQRNPALSPMCYRFLWNEGIGHWGRGNYVKARTFLFQDRLPKPLIYILLHPSLLFRILLGPRLDNRVKLKEQLQEQLDIDDILNDKRRLTKPNIDRKTQSLKES